MELVIRNRRLSESDLATIRCLIQAEGSQGRTHVSRRLCRLWEWRQSNGAYREIACRDLLRQLDRRRLIELPKPLHPARHPGYRNRVQAPGVATDAIDLCLDQIKTEIRIVAVESATQQHFLRDLLGAYHYLGYRQPAGPSMGYLVYWQDRPLACVRFGPSAWKVAARDQFIGWTSEQRRLGLKRLVNNDRFLILPWVKVAHLASFLLGRIGRRLAQDWLSVYQQSIVLAETFVDAQRFTGACYRAANWLCLGQSRGRGRNDRNHQGGEPIKSVWIYPLQRDFKRPLLEAAP
jgi:Domain of unknown function (DUF4338)